MAGLEGFSVAGSSLLAARYALPDLGMTGLADIGAGVRDMLSVTDLPCLVDGDNGYGDVKAVVRMVETYEALGVAAVTIEDQEAPVKRPGQEAALAVCEEDVILAKLRAAVQVRRSRDFWIIGRTDIYALAGVDAALRRAEAYLLAGADGLFVAGIRTDEDLWRVGQAFGNVPLVAVQYGTAGWPTMNPAELHAAGFDLIIYPHAMLAPACLAMQNALAELTAGIAGDGAAAPYRVDPAARATINAATRLEHWQDLNGLPGGGR